MVQMAAGEDWLWNEMEWQCQCKEEALFSSVVVLDGKIQTQKINITGRLGPEWPALAVSTGCQCDERSFKGQGAKTFCWPVATVGKVGRILVHWYFASHTSSGSGTD